MAARRSFPCAVLAVVLADLTLATCQNEVPTEPRNQPPTTRPSPQVAALITEVLVGAGNIALCDRNRDEKTAALLDAIPGTVFTAGDNVRTSGSTTDFNDCYGPSWGRHKARTRPAPGDLDYQTTDAGGYFSYFGTAAAGDADKGYYSYDLGSWHIIALNSNISTAAGSAQEQWLLADLAANPNQCILAYWHHPRFSSKGTTVRASVKPLWDALYAAGADVIVNAHYKLYERFAPQTPDEAPDPELGIRQFTVGTGGIGAEPFGSTIRPNSQVRQNGTYGVLKLTLAPGSYSWAFVPVKGQTFTDTGSDLCDRDVSVASVTVAPATTTVTAGSTVQLTATPRAADGTPLNRPVTWSTNAAQVATVSSNGLVTGVAQGSVTITAASEGQLGTSAVTVLPLPPPTPPGSNAVLIGAGDIATCGQSQTGDEATAALLDALQGTIFTAGDNTYEDGTATEFADCYGPSWGRHKSRTRPAAGNHEYHTVGAAGHFAYFGPAAGDANKGYYSYDLADWHIIALNSNVSMAAGSAQEQWLRADLAASTKQCTMAYWHHPRFNSGSHHGSTPSTQPLWQALYEAGAEIVVSSHEHLYERFAPQRPDGTSDPSTGIRQFTVGTGGRSLYSFGPALPNSQVRNSTTLGVLKLTLSPGSYSWEFVPVMGGSFGDTGSGSCHGATNPPPTNQAPTAQPGGPYSAAEGSAVSFNGSNSSDPDNDLPLSYAWSFGDGDTGSGATPSHSYATDGSYTVSLTVTDFRNASSAPATTTATISNVAPTVNAGSDMSLGVGATLNLSATFSDPGTGDAPWAYSIHWGDGSTETTGNTSNQGAPITASHSYGTTGSYTVEVTVTDKDGGAGSDELVATVTSGPPPPANGTTTHVTLTPTDTLRLGPLGVTGTFTARAWAGTQEVATPIKWWIRANGVASLAGTTCTAPCTKTVTALAVGVTLVDIHENVAGSTAARDQAHVKVTGTAP